MLMTVRLLRWLGTLLVLTLTLGLGLVNLRLYQPDPAGYAPDRVGPDVLAQLAFVRTALEDGSGAEMQQLFPEGYFFNYVLYGLAWVEVGLREQQGSTLHSRALEEARWALAQLDDPRARAPFSPQLDPPYGVFYVGWSSWLRGGTLLLGDKREAARLDVDCEALATAFERRESPFLPAYPGRAWPVDSTVAIAALRLCDQQGLGSYAALVDDWLLRAKRHLDPATGLLPHESDPVTGAGLGGARGSSLSIMMRFLPEIDALWAAEQYDRFREQFIGAPLGVPGVREYPQGAEGRGDVDSGPLIFGISASATVVTLGAALANGDHELAEAFLHETEAFGLPSSADGQKRYAFGLLPVGDAFLAWAKTGRRWLGAQQQERWEDRVGRWWRLGLHGLSLALLLICAIPIITLRKIEHRLSRKHGTGLDRKVL